MRLQICTFLRSNHTRLGGSINVGFYPIPCFLIFFFAILPAAHAATRITSRVSIDSNGIEVIGDSQHTIAVSNDGRYVAFVSSASDLVMGDTNNANDIFLRDRQTGDTTRVSVASSGLQGNDTSSFPSISDDGRYVAFVSKATNLVTGDTNGKSDIFVHDIDSGETRRVSVDSSGQQSDGDSLCPSISGDGRYVAFESDAGNLVSGDTNGASDVFIHDLQTGQTKRVSVDNRGKEGNDMSTISAISDDGRYIGFCSWADNLVAGDSNETQDVFVHDRLTRQRSAGSVSIPAASRETITASLPPSPATANTWPFGPMLLTW